MPDLSRERLGAPFRPRRARLVAYPAAAGILVVMVALAALGPGGAAWGDRLGFVLVGVAVAAVVARQGGVRAVPSESGLVVRNLFFTRRLDWAQVVQVRFGDGRPWAQLDLADGDTLAVMAVQRADGERGVAEARRLATLVAVHSRTARDD